MNIFIKMIVASLIFSVELHAKSQPTKKPQPGLQTNLQMSPISVQVSKTGEDIKETLRLEISNAKKEVTERIDKVGDNLKADIDRISDNVDSRLTVTTAVIGLVVGVPTVLITILGFFFTLRQKKDAEEDRKLSESVLRLLEKLNNNP